jgi:hydrogenase maturation protein HypF
MVVRLRLRVRGVVQGVGFRPFVHGLARSCGVTGFVGNDNAGVCIEVEGEASAVARFREGLTTLAPPLAHVESVSAHSIVPAGDTDFRIRASQATPGEVVPVSPDVAPCTDCLSEMRDPANRRHRYPFINCTNCGPRYTIVRDVPYDREQTTMAAFVMCAACRGEYASPASRRFHAQPNACPSCGPSLAWRLAGHSSDMARGEPALAAAVTLLRAGGIVAVKGVGGFHLACDASSSVAVRTLRMRKQREEKPFAVLVGDVETARSFARVSADEAALLQAPARPIVLLERLPGSEPLVSPAVAPGQQTLGVMLPPSPLHVLLAEAGPLVMTSGNVSEEPIARDNEEACERLGAIADAFLAHDRSIHVVCDDSVLRLHDGSELPIRRSRGYAPYPVQLAAASPSVLAVGAELKATACLTRDRYAFLTPHIGDVGNIETLDALARACDHLERLFRVTPVRVACDRHPGYLSSRWARQLARERSLPVTAVQHHHAHLASLLADHGLGADAEILAFTFDGTGYGDDGTIWGGEVLLGGFATFERVATLAPTPLPGGDAAIRHPARVALAQLREAGVAWQGTHPALALSASERCLLDTQLERGLNCVQSSSMGRLLDAVASLAGVRHAVTYEGQAAIELEALARAGDERVAPYALPVGEGPAAPLLLDGAALLRQVALDAAQGRNTRDIARAAHGAIAEAVVAVAERCREKRGVDLVGLTGGVFQNTLLAGLAARRLRRAGFTVLTHHRVPPNDGGLALGQAMVAIVTSEQA